MINPVLGSLTAALFFLSLPNSGSARMDVISISARPPDTSISRTCRTVVSSIRETSLRILKDSTTPDFVVHDRVHVRTPVLISSSLR